MRDHRFHLYAIKGIRYILYTVLFFLCIGQIVFIYKAIYKTHQVWNESNFSLGLSGAINIFIRTVSGTFGIDYKNAVILPDPLVIIILACAMILNFIVLLIIFRFETYLVNSANQSGLAIANANEHTHLQNQRLSQLPPPIPLKMEVLVDRLSKLENQKSGKRTH
jgi:hypothetical protein